MKKIEIKDVYNDVIKCSEVSDIIEVNSNSIIFKIPIVLDQNPLKDIYEVEIFNNKEEMIVTTIEVDENNKKIINYHKPEIIYRFIKTIKDNSIIYINIYFLLKSMLRQEKLRQLGI